jgi:hypothetical protein
MVRYRPLMLEDMVTSSSNYKLRLMSNEQKQDDWENEDEHGYEADVSTLTEDFSMDNSNLHAEQTLRST